MEIRPGNGKAADGCALGREDTRPPLLSGSCRLQPLRPPGPARPATTQGQLLEWPEAGDGIACYSVHEEMIIRRRALAKTQTVN